MDSLKRKRSNDDDDSDEEEDTDDEVWEEIEVAPPPSLAALPPTTTTTTTTTTTSTTSTSQHFEVEVPLQPQNQQSQSTLKRIRITKEMRELRIVGVQVHLLALVVAAKLRNNWANDVELRTILLSLNPPKLKNAPNLTRLDLDALIQWWLHRVSNDAAIKTDQISDSKADIINNDMDVDVDVDAGEPAVTQEDPPSSLQNLLDAAGNLSPSLPDNTKAILFTALCRLLGFNARLIASLHPQPISFAQTALAPCYRTSVPSLSDSKDAPKPSPTPRETNAIRLWTQIQFASSSTESLNFCSRTNRIVSDDSFEPPLTAPDQQQLVYVISINPDADSTFRDVSERFSTRWAGRVGKLRPKKTEDQEWWRTVVWLGSRSGDKTSDEVIEEKAIKKVKEKESMPTRFDGFKGNAIYALERHLTQSEVIHPLGPPHSIGTFKNELVYPRSSVHTVLSAINWRKQGLTVKPNETPLKRVKSRGTSIAKKREKELDRLNMERMEGDEVGGSGGVSEWTDLYGEWQTEPVVPEELLENGKIPRNRFGNFEVLHGNMMPSWGARVKLPGAAAVARKLGIDYAPVMTGFEHHKGRATPVLSGIIVLKENKEILLEACTEDMKHSKEKADKVKSKRAVSNWRKLVEKAIVMRDLNERYL
ncbi:hypothetical protein HDU79_009310 [Rhizoclosmatium sp. JEL0117]|nr:hypothetical protein HDU79_009310 [Rhizoclosmatium sp. JEL0117]